MISLHWSTLVSCLAALAIGLALGILFAHYRSKEKTEKTDKERQAAHYRGLQNKVLFMLFFLVIAGLTSLFYAQVIMKVPKGDLTEFYFIVGTLSGAFTGGVVGYTYGTSVGSARNAEAMRRLVNEGDKANTEPLAP